MANLLGAKTSQEQPYKASDLLLKFIDGEDQSGSVGPVQSTEEIQRNLLALAHAHNTLMKEQAELRKRSNARGIRRTSSTQKRQQET